MELLRVGFELLVQEVVDWTGRVGDTEARDVDEELALQGVAADEDREIVATAVGKGVGDADFAAFDDGAEADHIADGFLTGGVANFADLEIVDEDALAGIERAFRGEEGELELIVRGEADVAGPD